jgi:SAM-dependent methyltransferase
MGDGLSGLRRHLSPDAQTLNMQRHALYQRLADYYDKIYWWKDYDKETRFLFDVFDEYGVRVRDVLEVACGTGSHTRVLAARGCSVTGVDINPDMLRVARGKLGYRARFVQGDMRKLEAVVSRNHYDAVLCLFSSISYNQTIPELRRSIDGMFACARPGGLVVLDTHFSPKTFTDGYRGEDIFDDGKVMGARLSISKRRGDWGEISFRYLIHDDPNTIVLRNDVHRLGLFAISEVRRQMRLAGLERVRTFKDWSIKRSPVVPFPDTIFAGRKPAK